MRVLLIHHESQYFAGAEKMLGYFLEGVRDAEVTVAAVPESRVAEILPDKVKKCWLPANARFSLGAFARQVREIQERNKTTPFDVLHGWAARDWELTAAAARRTLVPAVGTLHDHPRAPFISRARQQLMRWSTRLGLRQVVCVSEAVRQACVEAGYPTARLAVVRNGLPPTATPVERPPVTRPFRLGFLGQFSERKGLRGLFQILDQLGSLGVGEWELAVAGDAQDDTGRRLRGEIEQTYATRDWWPKVRWCGWVKQPAEFLRSLDLLICPSSEFDPFPTVLLEAGQAGLPVLAARVGGVPEIVENRRTGWLFDAQAWNEAATALAQIMAKPELAREAGRCARKRVEAVFSVERMVGEYFELYRKAAIQ